MPTPHSPLAQKVYTLLKNVPAGKVTTYKQLALAAGSKGYRHIGSLLAHNPYAPQVPCHRVIKSDGNLGGFKGSTNGQTVIEKQQMLQKEGIQFDKHGKVANLELFLYIFGA